MKIAITAGDPNGIGYEVILKALEDPKILELFTPVIYGSAHAAQHYRRMMDLPNVQLNQISDADQAKEGFASIITVTEDSQPEPGVSTPRAGKDAFAALEAAVADLRAGKVDALVTAPINKKNIQSETFDFPGHTEYLEASYGDGAKALMILATETLRVALVTTHLPIGQLAEAITRENIVEKLTIFARSLHRDFACDNPRIAVLALNPHAGEEGLLGTEETEVIAPAIAEAREAGIQAFGPYPADGFFGSGAYAHFDGVLAMYHDQGLAPFKTIAMDRGFNFTAGLPYVRTSPDHGTGYDIAGQGVASAQSMREAIYAAIDIVRNRAIEDKAHANPLKRQFRPEDKKNRDKRRDSNAPAADSTAPNAAEKPANE
ncbi:MAG: 4-hydroxythreonine-4-phosphate dehydrogenase PdxA [Muribaculaceae bacterium]